MNNEQQILDAIYGAVNDLLKNATAPLPQPISTDVNFLPGFIQEYLIRRAVRSAEGIRQIAEHRQATVMALIGTISNSGNLPLVFQVTVEKIRAEGLMAREQARQLAIENDRKEIEAERDRYELKRIKERRPKRIAEPKYEKLRPRAHTRYDRHDPKAKNRD